MGSPFFQLSFIVLLKYTSFLGRFDQFFLERWMCDFNQSFGTFSNRHPFQRPCDAVFRDYVIYEMAGDVHQCAWLQELHNAADEISLLIPSNRFCGDDHPPELRHAAGHGKIDLSAVTAENPLTAGH